MVINDVLSSVLRSLRFNASVFFHSSYCGSWDVDTSGSGRCTFHLIASGNCFLHLPDGSDVIPLSAGDLVVFPRDALHSISNTSVTNNGSINISGNEAEICEVEESTQLICGYFDFDNPNQNPVINALPATVFIKGNKNLIEPRLQVMIDLMKSETEIATPGSDVVVDKLSEILFIYALRHYISEQAPQSGILAALSDTHIGRALDAIHDKPAEEWTVERLAAVAGISRAPFSKHFSDLLNKPPMTYVGEWRMQLANIALKEGKQSMLEIAESVGYNSEVAFRKAFKKITGVTPGEARKQAA